MPQLLNCAALAVVLTCWPLAVAALGLAWRMPPLGAAVAALVSTWFGVFPYDSLWRGPLWPYVAGVALVPAVLALAATPSSRGPTLRWGPAAPRRGGRRPRGPAHQPGLRPGRVRSMLLVALLLRARTGALAGRRVAARAVLRRHRGTGAPRPPPRAGQRGRSARRAVAAAVDPAPPLLQAATFSAPTGPLDYALGVPALAGLVLLVLRRRLGGWSGHTCSSRRCSSRERPTPPPLRALTGVFYTDVWRIAALFPLAGALAIGELGAAPRRVGRVRGGPAA